MKCEKSAANSIVIGSLLYSSIAGASKGLWSPAEIANGLVWRLTGRAVILREPFPTSRSQGSLRFLILLCQYRRVAAATRKGKAEVPALVPLGMAPQMACPGFDENGSEENTGTGGIDFLELVEAVCPRTVPVSECVGCVRSQATPDRQ